MRDPADCWTGDGDLLRRVSRSRPVVAVSDDSPRCQAVRGCETICGMESTYLLHSVSYAGTWGQAFLPLDQFVDKAAELGFDGVLLMAKRPHLSVLDYDAARRDELRERIEKRGLKAVAIAGYNNFSADMEHGDIPHREIQIHYIAELARLTRDLGGSLLRVFTSYQHPSSTYLAQWNLLVAALKECAKRAAEFGVTLGVQNHHDMAAGWETQRDLIAAVGEPNCKALFDAWSPALHGTDLGAAARQMAPLTPHTTIADYQLRPRYKYHAEVINYSAETPYAQAVPMGEGFIDYPAFLAGLRAGGFSGSIAYEMCSPLLHGGDIQTLDRYARRFLTYLRALP
jgi:sugar phosphate isomerase/epimerase